MTNPDTINLSGIVYVADNETLNNVVINLGSTVSGSEAVTLYSHDTSGGTLIFDSTATINSNAGAVYDDLQASMIFNHGHINVAAGSSLFVGPTTFENAGTVSIASGGTLFIEDDFALEGTRFAPEGAGALVLDGTIANGTFAPGSVSLALDNGTLDDVTYQGNLNVTDGLGVIGGLQVERADGSGPGTINLTGDGFLYIGDDETLDNVVINLGPAGNAPYDTNVLFPIAALTIGSAATINSTGSGVYADELEGSTIVNDGQINIAAGSDLYVGCYFIETGTVSIASGGTLISNGYIDLEGTTFAPQGAGTLMLGYTISNGTLAPGDVSVTLSGALLDDVTYQGSAGSRLVGFGTVNSSMANAGTIEANGGILDITGAITGTGILVIDTATLELGGKAAETVEFNGVSTLKLETPTGYTGTLSGLAHGDVIDIASTTVTSARLSGASLLVTLAGGTKLDYALAGTLASGAVTISSDGGTGSDITFLQQAAKSAASVADFSTMQFIAPPGNDRNVVPAAQGMNGPSGIAALADNAVFADGIKAASGSLNGTLTGSASAGAGGGFFADTFSSVAGLHAMISQRDAALLPPHAA